MRYLKYLVLLTVVALPAAYANAQVSIGVHIGGNYGLYNAPPVCEYGYYPDYPFGCAPYGYWGPQWFVNGVFIGAGPWYRFYFTHPEYYRRYYYARPHYRDYDDYRVRYYRERDWDHDRWRRHGDWHEDRRGDRFREREFHDHGRHRGWDHDRGRDRD